jgi:hypothetical protein
MLWDRFERRWDQLEPEEAFFRPTKTEKLFNVFIQLPEPD